MVSDTAIKLRKINYFGMLALACNAKEKALRLYNEFLN
jgi:hypothetical protein